MLLLNCVHGMHHLFSWRGTSLSKNISVWYEQHTPLGSHPSPSSILMLSLAVIQKRHTKERSTILKPNNGWSGKFCSKRHWTLLLGEVQTWSQVSLPPKGRTSPHVRRCIPWNTSRNSKLVPCVQVSIAFVQENSRCSSGVPDCVTDTSGAFNEAQEMCQRESQNVQTGQLFTWD
jgi:hypothetical protein